MENLNLEITKDILQLKFDSQNNDKKMFEEIEMYKLQNEALSESLNQLTRKITCDKESKMKMKGKLMKLPTFLGIKYNLLFIR